uniref:Schlafen AlbA-2 domain-containing protein n=1 Tax=Eptatretus burgeri TaxID=7764 RepID=A0A8C4X0E0_EPTBU
MYSCRLHLANLHFNENAERKQAATQKGDFAARPFKTAATFETQYMILGVLITSEYLDEDNPTLILFSSDLYQSIFNKNNSVIFQIVILVLININNIYRQCNRVGLGLNEFKKLCLKLYYQFRYSFDIVITTPDGMHFGENCRKKLVKGRKKEETKMFSSFLNNNVFNNGKSEISTWAIQVPIKNKDDESDKYHEYDGVGLDIGDKLDVLCLKCHEHYHYSWHAFPILGKDMHMKFEFFKSLPKENLIETRNRNIYRRVDAQTKPVKPEHNWWIRNRSSDVIKRIQQNNPNFRSSKRITKRTCFTPGEFLPLAESQFLEFKWYGGNWEECRKKICTNISGFANTYGGFLLYGVSDEKEVFGCKMDDSFDKDLKNIQSFYNEISKNLVTIKYIKVKDKDNTYVIVISVKPCTSTLISADYQPL